ncbi:uncharacterized protein [Oryza sativa Japonica Group]
MQVVVRPIYGRIITRDPIESHVTPTPLRPAGSINNVRIGGDELIDRTYVRYVQRRGMDLLCDNMVEEILVRLPEEQHLRRASAACRRYGDIIRRPGFATRHRELHSPLLSGGVVLHGVRRRCPRVDGTAAHVRGSYAFFLPAGAGDASASSSLELDLAGLLPSPTDRELAYLLSTGAADPDAARRSVFIVHSSSSAGLLLCCRGYVNPVHYYVCDPVARRCVALPELPWPPAFDKSGMLSVAAGGGGGFQVVLFEKRGFAHGGGHLDLEVFSSDSGEWAAMRIPRPQDLAGFRCFAPPHLRHDGAAAYWLGFEPRDRAVVYGAADHSIRLIPVPRRVHDPSALNRFVGERRGGALLRYAHFDAAEFEVWDTDDATPTRWALVHRAALKDVVARSPRAVAAKFVHGRIVRHIHHHDANWNWCSSFKLIGFDPVHDDDVFLFGATNGSGCVAAYSLTLGKLSLRCKIDTADGSSSLCGCDMFPYVRASTTSPRADIPGMVYTNA